LGQVTWRARRGTVWCRRRTSLVVTRQFSTNHAHIAWSIDADANRIAFDAQDRNRDILANCHLLLQLTRED
jgi:hypothetical protein